MGLDHRPWWWLPLLVKGTGRDAIGAIGTALVIIGRYAFLLAGVFLYCCWYRLLDMLLLLLMLMDYLLDRTQKRLDLIGLASGGGSNEHSTASSQLRWMPHLYISSFSLLNKGGDGLWNTPPIGSDSLFFTFSSRHDPGIQASRSNHGFSSPTLGEASESVGWNAVMPGGLKSSGRWHRLTYNKSTLAFLVSLCLLVEAPQRPRVLI